MLITLFYLLAKPLNVHTCYIDTSDGCGLSFLLTTLTASFWPVASDLCVCVCYPSIFCRVVKTYVEILVKFALLILFYLIKISFLNVIIYLHVISFKVLVDNTRKIYAPNFIKTGKFRFSTIKSTSLVKHCRLQGKQAVGHFQPKTLQQIKCLIYLVLKKGTIRPAANPQFKGKVGTQYSGPFISIVHV